MDGTRPSPSSALKLTIASSKSLRMLLLTRWTRGNRKTCFCTLRCPQFRFLNWTSNGEIWGRLIIGGLPGLDSSEVDSFDLLFTVWHDRWTDAFVSPQQYCCYKGTATPLQE